MIPYTHRVHPRARSIKIRVEPNGKVVVSTPRFASKQQIESFVAQSSEWIARTQKKILQKQEFGVTDTSITVFGKTYRLRKEENTPLPIGVRIEGSDLISHVLTRGNATEAHQKQLNRFLKNTAEKYLRPRTQQLAEKMGISFGVLTIRQQKTRWGSCSSQGNLNFNWRLVHCPTEVIDYVIIHELAHRKHMDHSDRFWGLVAKYDPEHQLHRGWLKRHGLALG